MDNYWLQFITIASAHALAVLSPGPDMLLVFQHSLTHKRPRVYYTCIGIGSAISIHSLSAIGGLGLLLHRYPLINKAFVIAGATFLLYLAYKAAQAGKFSLSLKQRNQPEPISNFGLWKLGFLTNALNIKAVFFFLSLFSVAIAPATPVWMQLSYVVYLMLTTALFFIALSWLFTMPAVARQLERYSLILQRMAALMFVVLAIMLVLSF